jgi:hypothetical protein
MHVNSLLIDIEMYEHYYVHDNLTLLLYVGVNQP